MRSIKEIMRASAVLDPNGVHIGGSDRESNHHYGDAYELILSVPDSNAPLRRYPPHIRPGLPRLSIRADVKLMMEVGVADGACLLAWREIFPNATIVGMDIHPSDRAHGERIEFHLGDQRKREDCERAAGGRQFDFIVEDATHKLADSLLTLYWLWPFVRPGGLYVVEEWEGVGGDRDRIRALFPFAEIVGTCGPHIADEPLVVMRKPL